MNAIGADYPTAAATRYAEDLEAETDLIAIAEAGNADGYMPVATEAKRAVPHQRIMDRVRASVAGGRS
jgi:hypothetical protein